MIKISVMTRYKQDTGITRWECTGLYGAVSGYPDPWQAWRAYMRLRKRMKANARNHEPG